MTLSLPQESTPSLQGSALNRLRGLDEQLRQWAEALGGTEQDFPVLIAAETLRRAEYAEAFPQLLMAAAVAKDPAEPLAGANVQLAGWHLSPAVCYHAYAQLAGQTLTEGRLLTARGHCFRHEDPAALAPGRRQIEFAMRELILVGEPDWIAARLETMPEAVAQLAGSAIEANWQPASDPFFLPRAQGKAHLQRLLGTKLEYCLADGLALASINRHGPFFGERFGIRTARGEAAHSACVAFGLDRWAHALLAS